jgi:hypothetical protein
MNQLLQETLIATGNVWAGFLVLKSTGTLKGSAISKTHPVLTLKQEDLDQVCLPAVKYPLNKLLN